MKNMFSQMEAVKTAINSSLKLIRLYDWLLDLYVLDFFVDDHWSKLPASWRESLRNIDTEYLGMILSGEHPNHILPLSLLALVSAVKALSLPRDNLKKYKIESLSCMDKDSCAGHPRLKNLFLKHVKLKKRHEISLMAEVVNHTALASKCEAVIDFGSGVGHLVRVLAYKNGLYAAGIECQNQLTEDARKLDHELEYTASKHLSKGAMSKLRRPTHFNVTLSTTNQLDHLSLPESMKSYGLIGLHPCGDLGPLLLRHFLNSDKVKFISVVGCCFMKLTNAGYPMSDYLRSLEFNLSYASTEISCHAIEVYCDRLKKGTYEDLKVHAYRAALERLLVDHDPKLKHVQVRSIKHSNNLNFRKYCELALERLGIPLPTSPHIWAKGEEDLAQWQRVVTVYSLRLALAPLVETVILLDRVLCVLEHGLSCEIRPVFDPKISPRNHIIVARR
ncbi:methyltransferase-like protein 25B [Pectinophora gossypiella]|uniref:methyltransferase-like protein 25B n=1 Tax=Pectinophora gossypiella TaxID=13191 RepID=UPI00214E3870|nr:methyltransferase-like protein 25B [Pectinophora gossypiella]